MLLTPANDVTNLKEKIEKGDVETVGKLVSDSSKVMAYLADRAVREFPNIKKVIVMERTPRVDNLEKASTIANKILEEEIKRIGNHKVVFKKHNIATQGLTKDQVFGVKGGRNDGVRLNVPNGEESYRKIVVNILEECGISRRKLGNQRWGQ